MEYQLRHLMRPSIFLLCTERYAHAFLVSRGDQYVWGTSSQQCRYAVGDAYAGPQIAPQRAITHRPERRLSGTPRAVDHMKALLFRHRRRTGKQRLEDPAPTSGSALFWTLFDPETRGNYRPLDSTLAMEATMPKKPTIWEDIVQYRRAYLLTAVASFGGMLFGWDTGLIGGVLTMKSFQDR